MRHFNPEFAAGGREFVEKPQNRYEQLKNMLGEISRRVNAEVLAKYGVQTLLDEQCKISIKGFNNRKSGGIYDESVLLESKAKVAELEYSFSGAANPAVQEFYQKKYGVYTEQGVVEAWKVNKEKEKNGQMEMAITALLYKVLKDRYMVARTHNYDDYINGADNIIVDKETGAVVCAFDEVHEGGMGDRQREKESKVKNVVKKGGASLRYGMHMKEGKLERTKLEHLPIFYLGLNTSELEELMDSMDYDPAAPASEVELKVFAKLVESLRQQVEDLAQVEGPKEVHARIASFKTSLQVLESYVKPVKH